MATKFKDDRKFPPSQSASGTNAYYHRCDLAEHHAPYAACLHSISEREAGNKIASGVCTDAIRTGSCPAVHMRKNEELAGEALYFIDRKAYHEFFVGQEMVAAEKMERQYMPPQRVVSSAPKSNRTTAAAPAPKKEEVTSDIGGNDFAAAINAALSGSPGNSSAPAAKIIPQSPVTVRKGMSLMDIARQSQQRSNTQ